jgi:hypothetical protein
MRNIAIYIKEATNEELKEVVEILESRNECVDIYTKKYIFENKKDKD